MRVIKQKRKMPRQVVGGPSLEVLTTPQYLGTTEGNFGVSPALSRELGEVSSSGPFHLNDSPILRLPTVKILTTEKMFVRRFQGGISIWASCFI